MLGLAKLTEWLSPDGWYLVGAAAILLLIGWSFVRHKLKFKMPRKYFIALCIIFSIGLHVGLLMVLPGLPGSGGGQHAGAGSSASQAISQPLASLDLADIPTDAMETASTSGESAAELSPPPMPMTLPTLPVDAPEPEHSAQEDSAPAPSVPPVAPAPPVLTRSLANDQGAADAVDKALSDLYLPDAAASSPTEAAPPTAQPNTNTAPTDSAAMPPLHADAPPSPANPAAATTMNGSVSSQAMTADALRARSAQSNVPQDFANRSSDARWAAVRAGGGDERTEAAVEAALLFLVATQEPDGRWSAAKYGAGREEQVFGHTRGGAGRGADSGVTGLALLALLGRGVTPQDPQYGPAVVRGLEYLRQIQKPDGSLAGGADAYAAMYCHGIAALAVTEAYAMTGDPSIRQVAQAALAYTLRCQHPTTGGWRYQPGDTGDLSQFGWQAIALQTGKWAGLAIPDFVRPRMETFLRSVRGGTSGGLGCYRPGERPTASMTAEGLASRLLLDLPVSEYEAIEAENLILSERPGVGRDNLYFWYYASLALHQRGNSSWDIWNQALKGRLLATQANDGSWPTDSVWGGYGGKIYTTALGALCLEVYYRHLSIYRGPTSVAGQANTPTNSWR